MLFLILSRDSQDDFFRHFHTFFQILTEIIQKLAAGENIDGKKTNGPNPELVGKVFECMSFLIRSDGAPQYNLSISRYQTPSLLKDYDTLRKYYGPLLGNRTSYVREFSSQMFIILLRKLSTKQFKSHLRNVLRAIAVSCANKHFGQQLSEVTANLVLDLPIPRIEGEITSDDISIRAQDLLEGVALLIFSTTKGIKNCLHSKGAEILKASLSLMSPLSVQSIEEIMTLSNKEKRKRSTGIVQVSQLSDTNQKNILRMTVVDVFGHYCSGRIFVDAIGRLFRHCHPANMSDLWISMLDHLDGVKQSYEAFLCLSEPSLELTTALEISISFTVEIFDFALCHSNHRAISSVPLLSERIILTIYGFVRHFLESEVFIRSSASTHRVIFSDRLTSRIRTLCTSLWSSFSRNPIFSKLKLEFIDIILGKPLQMLPKNESNVSFSISTGVKTVLNELFPLLPRTEVRDLLLHPFFTAIASLQQREDKSWVRLFYEVLIYLADNREHVDQTLQIHPGHQDLQFSYPEFHTLLQSCLSLSQLTSSDLLSSSVQKYQMIYAWKCLCWVISFEPDICLKSDILESIQELASSLTTTILPTLISQSHLSQSHHVLLSTALDTACSICTLFINSNTESVVLIGEALKSQLVDQFLGDLVNLLCTASPTLLLLWCFRRLLSFIICPFHDLLDGEESQRHRLISFLTQKQQEGLFNTLSYGLLNPSYWMRRESLQILLYFPPPAVIQNQSQSVNEHERDLDDEFELSERIVCDVVKLCYEAVSLEVCFKNEREFSRRLAQLEVFINSSSLPSEYSRVVSSFCLGILFVKFQPLWSPAVKVLMSAVLSEESEAVTWPLILYVLNYLGQKHETTPQVTFDSSKVDPYQYFETINSGEAPIEINFAESPQFLYTFNRYNDAGIVQPDSRTDVQTAYDTVWDVFQKCPSITLRHSKVVVPMFVAFLKDQYYMKFSDDPELPTIYYSGLFNIPEISNRTETVKAPDLSIPVTKKRLILFLKVFAAVTSPKQLYHHQALYKFYTTILSKPDTTVAKLALDCLLTYKPPSLVPYQKSLKNFFDDSALRNELLIFDPSLSSQNQSGETAEKIELSDRTVLIPVMIRILYGRFVSKSKGSKSAREQGLARFFSSLL